MIKRQNVYVVDDDIEVRKSTVGLLTAAGFHPRAYDSGEAFLGALPTLPSGCALVDIRMPSMDCEQVIAGLGERIEDVPVMMMSGNGDIAMAVRTMQCGASDFLPKPFHHNTLVDSLRAAFRRLDDRSEGLQRRTEARARLARLSTRESAVLAGLAEGYSNKNVAWHLDLSVRTVEMYRANMMGRLAVKSLPEALQLLFSAEVAAERFARSGNIEAVAA